MITNIVAILAPFVSCIQLFPQLYKTYITKSVDDLSINSLLLILLANILWSIHGFFIVNLPLMLSGLISMTINILLITLFMIYK